MKEKKTGVLSFLSFHNPFYLVSALTMLVGCFLIINPWARGGRKFADLFLSWGVLTGYEITVIAMAIILHRMKRAGRDVGKLVFVSLLFMFDCVFLADAFSISGGDFSGYLVAAIFSIALAKFVALLVGLRIRIEIDSLIFSCFSLLIVFAAPVIVSSCIHADANCEAALFFLWASFAAVVLGFTLWRFLSKRIWVKDRAGRFWRLLCLMSLIMGTVHLVAVGLELSGGFALWFVAPLLCTMPLVLRVFFPSFCKLPSFPHFIDSSCAAAALIVFLTWLDGDGFSLSAAAGELSYRLTFTVSFAVYGILGLMERRLHHLLSGTGIAFFAALFSRPLIEMLPLNGVLLCAAGLSASYVFSVLFIRGRTRTFLSFMTAALYLLLMGVLAGFGAASVFAFLQWTGLTLLLFEFLLWRDSMPFYRNVLVAGLLASAAVSMFLSGGFLSGIFYGAEAASFIVIGLMLHLRSLTCISAAGFLPVLAYARPDSARGWGITLAASAACMLAFGFWLSVRGVRSRPAAKRERTLFDEHDT